MRKWVVNCEGNTYIVCDEPAEFGDDYILVSKEDETVAEEPWPSAKDSYNMVKVLWYHETGRKLIRNDHNVEQQLINELTNELTAQIDAEIMRRILEERNS